MTSSANAALSQWSMDREIVMSRVIDAPRDLVFEAWSDPKHLPQWFGPKRDGDLTFVRARDWLGPTEHVERDVALAELAVRYLRSHAPATPEDLSAW